MLKLKSHQFRFQFKAVFSRFLIDFEDYLRVLLKTKEKKRIIGGFAYEFLLLLLSSLSLFIYFFFFGGFDQFNLEGTFDLHFWLEP